MIDMNERESAPLKLYSWHPKYHGPESIFIMAENINIAKEKVKDYLEKEEPDTLEDWPSEYYDVEIREKYEVDLNSND